MCTNPERFGQFDEITTTETIDIEKVHNVEMDD